jgi:hypothetical protein
MLFSKIAVTEKIEFLGRKDREERASPRHHGYVKHFGLSYEYQL